MLSCNVYITLAINLYGIRWNDLSRWRTSLNVKPSLNIGNGELWLLFMSYDDKWSLIRRNIFAVTTLWTLKKCQPNICHLYISYTYTIIFVLFRKIPLYLVCHLSNLNKEFCYRWIHLFDHGYVHWALLVTKVSHEHFYTWMHVSYMYCIHCIISVYVIIVVNIFNQFCRASQDANMCRYAK